MDYTSPFPILDTLVPGAQTRAGVAWRLYWLWPELRGLNLFAVMAWSFAAFASGGYFETAAYAGKGVFAPVELAAFIPILYLGFLSGAPNGGYAPGCGRALAMLPVRRTCLRDAVWFIDVPAAALVFLVLATLAALVLPSPGPHRAWYLAAAALTALLYAGGRAAFSIASNIPLRGAPQGNWEHTARSIDKPAIWYFFLAFLGMLYAQKAPMATGIAGFAAVLAFAWSFVRRPMMSGTRGDGTTQKQKGGPAFSSGAWEIARLYASPAFFTLAVMAGLALMFFVAKPNKSGEFPYFMVIVTTSGLGQLLAMRVRASRVLPLSTRALTLAVLAFGLVAALPLVLLMAIQGAAGPPGLTSALMLTSVALGMSAMAAGSIWALFYMLRWVFAYMATAMAVAFLFIGNMPSVEHPPTLLLALPAVAIAALFLAAITWSIDRLFWRDSKVYRHQFQFQQGRAAISNFSTKGDNWMLALVAFVAVVGVGCTLFWLVA